MVVCGTVIPGNAKTGQFLVAGATQELVTQG